MPEMPETGNDQQRPCLHCMTAVSGGSDIVDTYEADEVIVAIAKTVAELTYRQDGMIRQQLIEQLMREIINYDAAFHRQDAASTIGSRARH